MSRIDWPSVLDEAARIVAEYDTLVQLLGGHPSQPRLLDTHPFEIIIQFHWRKMFFEASVLLRFGCEIHLRLI